MQVESQAVEAVEEIQEAEEVERTENVHEDPLDETNEQSNAEEHIHAGSSQEGSFIL